jgi:hypothetical protein
VVRNYQVSPARLTNDPLTTDNFLSAIPSENPEKDNPDYQNRVEYIYVSFFGKNLAAGTGFWAFWGPGGRFFNMKWTRGRKKVGNRGIRKADNA